MPKQEGQKSKLLALLHIFEQQTDEEHLLNVPQLVELLARQGILCERKSVYSDIDALNALGYDIRLRRGRSGGYWMATRPFELAELKLLVDAVQSSRVISKASSDKLIHKLEGLASQYEGSQLQRQVYVDGRPKSANKDLPYSVDALFTAINTGRMVRFRYKKAGRPAPYTISPWQMAWENGCYYLIAYQDEKEPVGIRHYRVDKMAGVTVLDEPRRGKEQFADLDLYEYDYTDYYTTGSASVTFGGEKQITSAIYKLTAAGQSHAYYTTNHGEQTLTDSLTDALDAQNIDAQPLDLLTSTIPEDCDLLIINAPTTDFSAGDGLVDEISQLQNYLAAGGKLLLTSSVYAQTPQLDAVLAQFGLARAEGMVVEGDSSKALYNSAWSLLPDYGTPTESTALNGVNTSTHVMLSVAQGITVTETEDVTAEPLLNSSSAAYAKADINNLTTMEREEGDADGPFALAVWARNEDTGAEVLWIGCPNMDNEQLYQSMPGNLTFLQGCAASLVGQDILVDTKALEAEPITVAGSTAAALGLTFVFVLPAAVLIAGAVVVLLRRRR